MATLMQASQQWATRPDDERFISLPDMLQMMERVRSESREVVVPSRRIALQPEDDNKGLRVVGPNGHAYTPTHWAFGQLAQLSESPAGYLRTLPSPIAADCLNYGLQFKRNIEDVGVLLQRNGEHILRAATGPRYGRIWNADIVRSLIDRVGDGVSGNWRVPGEFGQRVDVNKANTTLYASDRDMWVFLCDEDRRIEIPNRRAGESGSMARGFFMWNSEVGSATFGLATFLFDYVCCNRIVWGAEQYQEFKLRHTAAAPDKFMQEIAPALETYANASAAGVTEAIEQARKDRLDDVGEWLSKRFGKRMAATLTATHLLEEQRPIETRWDAVTAATAYARSITHQDARVDIERQAGELLAA